jgi:hypothetical protein
MVRCDATANALVDEVRFEQARKQAQLQSGTQEIHRCRTNERIGSKSRGKSRYWVTALHVCVVHADDCSQRCFETIGRGISASEMGNF